MFKTYYRPALTTATQIDMAKTAEEIEAIHVARAAKKGMLPALPTEEPADGYDGIDPEPEPRATDDADPRDQEIEDLRQQLAAVSGRVAPSQQQAEEYRRLYDEERRARERERDALEQRIRDFEEERATAFDPAEVLSEEELELYDPAQLELMAKIAQAAAKKSSARIDIRAETNKILAEREAQAVNSHREDWLTDPRKGLHRLSTLAHDPHFVDWTNREGNEDFDPLVRSLLAARTAAEVDRYAKAVAKRVAKYNEQRNGKTSTTDANTSLHRGMQRRPSRQSDGDIEAMLAQAKQLARSRNPADRKKAQDILNSL